MNFPNSATREEVAEVSHWPMSWAVRAPPSTATAPATSRCSTSAGSTTARKRPPSTEAVLDAQYGQHSAPAPTRMTQGFTEKVKIGCGNLYITVNSDEKGICRCSPTPAAPAAPASREATARLVSVAIRSGVDPREIVQQLKGILLPPPSARRD